jgi:aryl-alcohol dehydrogenase-like predicted oxidoreductase
MQYVRLGNSGLVVSRLCFGGLIIGPLQSDFPADKGGEVILKALELGVNFIDTAELYGTYGHIKHALQKWQGEKPVIATKSYAYSKEGAEKSLEKARKELDCDVIDIFMLHEQETRLTLRGHREALEYYISEKEKGRIKAVGVSTHNIEVVEACADMPEIDVIHPLVNITGLGIGDGSIDEMLVAVEKACQKGKGVFSMKPLGGGNLLARYDQCMSFVLENPNIHSIAVGMQSLEEVIANVSLFEGKEVPSEVKNALRKTSRKLHVDFWCTACGNCIKRCGQGAISIVDGKAKADMDKCVLCGYCSSVCPEFAIKVC